MLRRKLERHGQIVRAATTMANTGEYSDWSEIAAAFDQNAFPEARTIRIKIHDTLDAACKSAKKNLGGA